MILFDDVLTAYRAGKSWDFLRFRVDGFYGVWFMMPDTPAALQRVGEQYRAMRADGLILFQRSHVDGREAIICTMLPEEMQYVCDLETGQPIAAEYVQNEALASLQLPVVYATTQKSDARSAKLKQHSPQEIEQILHALLGNGTSIAANG
jgi:hypothetical protein